MRPEGRPTGERPINLYEVLQISSNASPQVVQAAYRALARVYHPDRNTSSEPVRAPLAPVAAVTSRAPTGGARMGRLIGVASIVILLIASAACGVYQLAGMLDDEPMPGQLRTAQFSQNVEPPRSSSSSVSL